MYISNENDKKKDKIHSFKIEFILKISILLSFSLSKLKIILISFKNKSDYNPIKIVQSVD